MHFFSNNNADLMFTVFDFITQASFKSVNEFLIFIFNFIYFLLNTNV